MLPIHSNLDTNSNLIHETNAVKPVLRNLGKEMIQSLGQRTNVYRKGKKVKKNLY